MQNQCVITGFIASLIIFVAITMSHLYTSKYVVANNKFKRGLNTEYGIYRCYQDDIMLFNNNGTFINIGDALLKDFENNTDLQFTLLYFKLIGISMNLYSPIINENSPIINEIINYTKYFDHDIFTHVLLIYMYQENQYLQNIIKYNKWNNKITQQLFYNNTEHNCFKVNMSLDITKEEFHNTYSSSTSHSDNESVKQHDEI